GFEVRFAGPLNAVIYYTLDGSDPRLPGGYIAPGAYGFTPGGRDEILVPIGAQWRWFADAEGLGSSVIVEGHPDWSAENWKHPEFDDGTWQEGPAQLGYGESDEATTI